jgi:hypothetical protein
MGIRSLATVLFALGREPAQYDLLRNLSQSRCPCQDASVECIDYIIYDNIKGLESNSEKLLHSTAI